MQTRSQKPNTENAKMTKRAGDSMLLDPKRQRKGEVEIGLEEGDDVYEDSFSNDEESYNFADEMELLKIADPEAYEAAQEVKAEIERSEPTILKILKEPLCLESKTRLVHLFEVYRNSPQCTEETLEIRAKLIKEFGQAKDDYKERSKLSFSRQKEIAARLDMMEAETGRLSVCLHRKLKELGVLKESLLRHAFNGQLS